jgi:hypothetical protein
MAIKKFLTLNKLHIELETEEENTESHIDKLQYQFKNLDLNKMVSISNNAPGRMLRNNNYNRKYTTPHISITHNWYPKPTPPYILNFSLLPFKEQFHSIYIYILCLYVFFF